jgi:acyl-coenzyme A thioesterase PaaI-like protein
MTRDAVAFQDLMHDNFCWGCGADNPDGLRLKSWWEGDVAVAHFTPSPAHAAGPRHFLNGGIIGTLIDCHGICTAVADAHRREGREIGSDPELWYATASLHVEYLRPASISAPVELRATVTGVDDRATTVECTLSSEGKPRAQAIIGAVQVPDSWRHGTDRR